MIGSTGDSLSGAGQAGTGTRLLARFAVFGLAVLLVAGTLTARLFYLQVAQGGYYSRQEQLQSVVLQPLPSERGLIVDSAGDPLVINVPSYSVKVRPADLPFTERDAVVSRLSQLLGISTTQINETIDANPGSRFDLVRIASNVDASVARFISEESYALPGVQVVVEAQRQYKYGSLLSQILGYTGAISPQQLQQLQGKGYQPDDFIGQAGLEAQYETQLRGTYGMEQVERDAAGRPIQVLSVLQQPQTGDTLQLSINLQMQAEAQKALEWALKTAGLQKGTFILMDPQTGQVLAMVNLPTYDDNQFAKGITTSEYQKLVNDPLDPLLNNAIQEQYAPGSTYKLVTASAGLADGKITPSTLIQTYPFLTLGSQRFYDWNHAGFGPLNVIGALAQSSDTFFYQLAAMVGIDKLAYWAKQFGFGAPTGIDLPGEVSGIVPSNAWKMDTLGQPIYPGEVYLAGIGQGYDAVTPIQLIDAYSALINGGKLYQPQVVSKILAPDGSVVRPFKPILTRKIDIPQSVLQTVREGDHEAVLIRHTLNLVDMPICTAAKTGTAQYGSQKIGGHLPFNTWVAGWVSPSCNFAKTNDVHLAFVAFAFDSSNSLGNVALEAVQYFLQMHFHMKKDYRLPNLIEPIY